MKKNIFISTLLILTALCSKAQNANTALSNLISPTAVNVNLLPATDSAINLGAAAKSLKDVYFKGIIYKGSNKFISTIRESTFIGVGAGNNPGTAAQNFNTATGYRSLYLNTGRYNTANGNNAMYQGSGTYNTGIGASALYSNSGAGNTGIGAFALYTNNTGSYNTATGRNALFKNTVGTGNTANGYNALYSNAANYNTANGYQALFLNTAGTFNTATGYNALQNNTGGYQNTAVGSSALYYNSIGNYNTAVGDGALSGNVSGFENVAVGEAALLYNTASGNTAVGSQALTYNTSGQSNTAIGLNAMNDNATGFYNTALGAGSSINNYSNATAIGVGATATASNQVMLGSTSVTSVKAAGSFTIYSDGRFKKNITENVPGLEFIKQLRPVTYNYDIHGLNSFIGVRNSSVENEQENSEAAKQMEDAIINKEKKIFTGFIAQEVEVAANKSGYDFGGLYKPQNNKDPYGLSYADFVVPLVKAVQELSQQNDEKDTKISDLQQQINELKTLVQSVAKENGMNAANSLTLSGASLEQNAPNPFTNSTSIGYTLPEKFIQARIIVTDKNGKTVQSVNLSGSGKGVFKFDASAHASGTYSYTLIVDGKRIGSKTMIMVR